LRNKFDGETLDFENLKKNRVRLSDKSTLMDAEFKKLENEIKEAFLIGKPRMAR